MKAFASKFLLSSETKITLTKGLLFLVKKQDRYFVYYLDEPPIEEIEKLLKVLKKKSISIEKVFCSDPNLKAFLFSKLDATIKTKFSNIKNPIPVVVFLNGVIRIPKTDHENRLRIFILDDSKAMRIFIKKSLDPKRFEIVGESGDPILALDEVAKINPDFLTVDLQMPGLRGDEFLKKLRFPIPSIVISSLSMTESDAVLNALEAGALDYIKKPEGANLFSFSETLSTKIESLAHAKVQRSEKHIRVLSKGSLKKKYDLIVIGSSTGGTEALKVCFEKMPSEFPPIVVAQHLPEFYTHSFAQRLSEQLNLSVFELNQDEILKENTVYIIQGGRNASILRSKSGGFQSVLEMPLKTGFVPSADRLFQSSAQLNLNNRLAALVLTGMGSDGAQGALAIHQQGGLVLGQCQESSVVYGMPRAAREIGATTEELPPSLMIEHLLKT
jgi:two-component system chemotaxis response regulator CheB